MEMGGFQPVLLYFLSSVCHERCHFECQFRLKMFMALIHPISQDIESDLIHATSDVLPRIMHRLLYTLSYDRKVSYVFFFPSHFHSSITVILALTIGKQPFANNTTSEILNQILLGRNRKYSTRKTIFNLLKGRRLLWWLTHQL
jgi:hypothetical protein